MMRSGASCQLLKVRRLQVHYQQGSSEGPQSSCTVFAEFLSCAVDSGEFNSLRLIRQSTAGLMLRHKQLSLTQKKQTNPPKKEVNGTKLWPWQPFSQRQNLTRTQRDVG